MTVATNARTNKAVDAFEHHYVGIESLAQLATKEDRVCVLNILGGESRTVTPISNEYSGGNIVCGTMPGRSGSVMKTKAGDIPVYNNIAEALEAGHKFNVAVVYVPPAGVKDAVIEAVRVNADINKVVILTEKVPLSDSRIIRAYCQMQKVDVFGANCLGLGDAHQHVRIGGALGGNAPEESLVAGSVALFSNSGNFTTTIATYLLTAGWGTTTSVSSGKDVYIHFAAGEFVHALHNDDRSKAAVMYIEPGGYYEHDIVLEKPAVVCVVGRWKAKLTRACGHAGAIAGAGDNAYEKEKWFMEKFGVDDIYSPENPVYSAKGAVVTNIAHIPEALSAVMKLNNVEPDFAPQGDLSLKCWFSSNINDDIGLPEALQLPVVEAIEPYNQQIEILGEQVGMAFPRQNMKDASSASMMDPKTQVSRLHGVSVLDCAKHALEENLVLSLVRDYPNENGRALANVALNAYVNQGGTTLAAAADASREAGNSPNTVLSSAVSILGPNCAKSAHNSANAMIKAFGHSGLLNPSDTFFDISSQLEQAQANADEILCSEEGSELAQQMLAAIKKREAKSVFINFIEALAERSGKAVGDQAVLAAIAAHLSWNALMNKRLSIITVANIPWHFKIFAALVGASVAGSEQDGRQFRGVSNQELMESWSFAETAYLAQLGKRPTAGDLFAFSILLGLIVSNGPGTISAQGPKGAVAADGPEVPDRVQVNKAYTGFLTHTGYAHGGNGFEAMEFLIRQFGDQNLADPGDKGHGLNLEEMATAYAREYAGYKKKAKAEGNLSYAKIPCINHPVFKGKDVNFDPREVFVRDLINDRGSYNIFLEYYHELVEALCRTGVSRNVYCVNVDAVIAVILLKILWQPFKDGLFSEKELETAAFTVFLYGRMIGSAAEIDDHTNRGRNMDTRTPASQCRYVS